MENTKPQGKTVKKILMFAAVVIVALVVIANCFTVVQGRPYRCGGYPGQG